MACVGKIQIPQMKIFFGYLKPQHGTKMAHSIPRTHYLYVNMYDNTGDILSFGQNINLISDETSKISETHFSSIKVEKNALIEMEKYYGAYYDNKWYLLCVISYDDIL